MIRPVRRVLLVWVFVVPAIAPSVAPAQETRPAEVVASGQVFVDALTTALKSGNFAAALALLEDYPDIAATAEGVRLRAELLARSGRSSEAIALLEGHLAQDGTDALARYQVGEIHFNARRDASAILAYRLALAGHLDPERRRLVVDRLAALEARRDVRFSLSFGVAPDSNLNSATSASTIDIFGLPFTLSDEARRRSGVAASISSAVERRGRISDGFSMLVGGSLTLLDAPGRAFDQRQVGVFAGPEIMLAPYTRASMAVTYRNIALGGEGLETWAGVRVDGEGYANPQTLWSASAHLDQISNQRAGEWDGWTYGGQVNRTRFLGPSAFWRASAAWDVHDLAGSEAGFQMQQLAVGRLVSLPFSSLAYIEPYARRRDFEHRSSAFGVRREDHEIGVNVRISKRDWAFRGSFPYVQGVSSRSWSNVALGEYSRHRLEFGLTRDF